MIIQKEVLVIPYVPPERNYWLVRTQGGKYYNSFHLNNYIAIAWNEIGVNIIEMTSEDKPLTKEQVFEAYGNIYKNNEKKLKYYSRSASRITNTINRFTHEIKKGDIVIIPSTDSSEVSFGEVLEDNIYFESNFPTTQPKERADEKFCPFIKRKKVNWLKTVRRSELDPKLYALFHSQHTISSADKDLYGNYIDRTIDSIYIKGETAHLVLEVKQKKDINALVFANLIKDSVVSVDALKDISLKNQVSGKNIKIKANVQSPGPIEFFGPIYEILLLTVIIKQTFGSDIISFKLGKKKDSKVDRLLKDFEKEEFGKYKKMIGSDSVDTDGIRDSLENLEIHDPTGNINSN